jgi:predicted permease
MNMDRWPYAARHFLRALFRRNRVEGELDEELRYHLEQRIQNDIACGVPPAEARAAALRAMGGIELRKEECRDMRKARTVEQFLQDTRYGLRSLARSPAFTAVTVLSLALGIGANTAIFSLMDKLLLESLPVERPRELVLLNPLGLQNGWTAGDMMWSYPAYLGIRDGQRAFTGVLAERAETVNLTVNSTTQRAAARIVSGNYFDVLGVRPMLGRVFSEADDRVRGGHPLAVISHGFWVEQFGSRPDVLGQTIRINRHPFTIVGVSEKGFSGLEIGGTVDVFVPAAMLREVTTYGGALNARTSYIWLVYGRLKPGVSRQQAIAQLQPIYLAQLEQDVAAMGARGPRDEKWRGGKITLEDGHRGTSDLRGSLETPLTAVMAMTGVVLLIACANIAGLLMARGASRSREISIRLAIGASRGRIVRQLLAESALLTAFGAVAGVLVAEWTIRVLVAEMGESAGRLRMVMHFLDARVLGFALAASIVTGLLFALIPALTAARAPVSASLKSGVGLDATGQVRLRKVLVTAQVAMGLVLVTASGLFLRTLENLRHTQVGFRTDRLIQFRLNSGVAGYDRARSIALFQQVLSDLREVHGVSDATAAVSPVLSNSMIGFGLDVEGYTPQDGRNPVASANAVAPGYFSMTGTPLLRGRDFTEADTSASPRVAIVNESFVKRYCPDGEPLGKKITLGYGGKARYSHEIVGVVRDARLNNLRTAPERNFFLPYTQFDVLSATYFYVRYAGDAEAISTQVRQIVKRHDADVPVVNYRTVEEQIDRMLRPERLVASLSLAFGLLATGLAAIGLYGVTAFAVARRTREIGIRIALGAERMVVVRMVLRDVAGMAGAGIALGVASAFGLARYVESQLYGIPPRDIATFMTAAAVLGVVALASGWLPARRASRVDPIRALRQE